MQRLHGAEEDLFRFHELDGRQSRRIWLLLKRVNITNLQVTVLNTLNSMKYHLNHGEYQASELNFGQRGVVRVKRRSPLPYKNF
jgi:hypothetical protein